MPGPEVYDLRRKREGTPEIDRPKERDVARAGGDPWAPAHGDVAFGSNSLAVSGELTSNGRALVANDMHLEIRVPNTWYRAVLEWRDEADASQTRLLAGLTLPGHPTLVTGSNTYLAWGFTNAQVDTSDLVLLELDPRDPNRYRTPWGWHGFDRYTETIEVKGGEPVKMDVRWTIWGPVLGADYKGRLRAYAWTAHSAERLASSLLPLESARTIEEALDAANGLGTPAQNLVVADRSGRIAWTIYGALPRRIGMTGYLPESWADGWRGWNGWLTPAEYPRIVDPPGGRLWTANARVVDGSMLAALGDGNYDIGARARRDSRSAARARAVHRARSARHPARCPIHVPVTLARPDPAPSRPRHHRRRRGARALPRNRREGLDRRGLAGFGRLPADAHVPRSGDGARHLVRGGRVLRGRPEVQLHVDPPARGSHLEAGHRSAPHSAEPGLRLVETIC